MLTTEYRKSSETQLGWRLHVSKWIDNSVPCDHVRVGLNALHIRCKHCVRLCTSHPMCSDMYRRQLSTNNYKDNTKHTPMKV